MAANQSKQNEARSREKERRRRKRIERERERKRKRSTESTSRADDFKWDPSIVLRYLALIMKWLYMRVMRWHWTKWGNCMHSNLFDCTQLYRCCHHASCRCCWDTLNIHTTSISCIQSSVSPLSSHWCSPSSWCLPFLTFGVTIY